MGAVKHATQSAVADDPAHDVSSGEWNANHNCPNFHIPLGTVQDGTWTDMPAALTEYPIAPQFRTKADLTYATDARLVLNLRFVGATGAKLRVQYSTDQSAWDYLDGVSGPSITIDTGAGTCVASGWVALAAGAKADVFLRLVGIDGDAVADPRVSNVQVQVR